MEPLSCEGYKRKLKVWTISMVKGGFISYMERLHGYDHEVMKIFLSGWKERMLMIQGLQFIIYEELILVVIGL